MCLLGNRVLAYSSGLKKCEILLFFFICYFESFLFEVLKFRFPVLLQSARFKFDVAVCPLSDG